MENESGLVNNFAVIDELNAGQRLDKFLMKKWNKAAKSFIYKMLRKKRIKLNKKKAEGNEMLVPGDIITFYIAPETMASLTEEKVANKKAGTLNIVYEDENIIICNKPSGVLTHSESIDDSDTIVDRALLHVSQNNEKPPFIPVCVNRLDRNTSGIVLIAKNLPSAQALSEILRDRKADKYYVAVVYGKIDKSITITESLEKNKEENKVYISSNGRASRTEIEPVVIKEEYTVLRIRLITGRTHQIRAHLSHIGHSIIGDIKYGKRNVNQIYKQKYNINSQLLHAYKIQFYEIDGYLSYLNGKIFETELPENFKLFK